MWKGNILIQSQPTEAGVHPEHLPQQTYLELSDWNRFRISPAHPQEAEKSSCWSGPHPEEPLPRGQRQIQHRKDLASVPQPVHQPSLKETTTENYNQSAYSDELSLSFLLRTHEKPEGVVERAWAPEQDRPWRDLSIPIGLLSYE
ncbi:hypothetical protein STEG23_036365 [Scotinomys teguina]